MEALEYSKKLRQLVTEDWGFPDFSGGNGLYGLHPYPAKFIPQIPIKIIEKLQIPKDTLIFDPFCGSGTTLIAAQEMGYETIGADLNPIAALISKVATTPLPDVSLSALEQLKRRYEKITINSIPDIPNVDHWFKKDIQVEIERIYQSISKESNPDVKDIFSLALSSIIVKFSNQESDTRYAAVDKNVPSTNLFPSFLDVIHNYFDVLNKKEKPVSNIYNDDSLSIQTSIFKKQVGLTLTSPPYPNAYEYWLYHKYRMYWLRFDPIFVKSKEIGSRPHYFKKEPEKVETFYNQIDTIFSLLSKITMPNGFACFVVGNSKIHGKIIDNSEFIIKAAIANGFSKFACLPRKINQNRKSFNLKNSRAINEDILIFKKSVGQYEKIKFYFNDYKYFPYEKVFAARELTACKDIRSIDLCNNDFIEIEYNGNHLSNFKNLTYFDYFENTNEKIKIDQKIIESSCSKKRVQNTRYGVHGLHEYKGKFNPQIVKSIFNNFLIYNKTILDPFCGSGTSLIEGAYLQNQSIGLDINPFAVFLTNTKLHSISINTEKIKKVLTSVLKEISRLKTYSVSDNERDEYLSVWFAEDIKVIIENYKNLLQSKDADIRDFLLLCMSNILRDYSLQEPSDLRIRRRKSPMPPISILDALEKEVNKNIEKIQCIQKLNITYNTQSYATFGDVREDQYLKNFRNMFDFIITSPPYATALPYIDTQRLSSVWLSLISAKEIRDYERILIGTRELSKTQLGINKDKLHADTTMPSGVLDICLYLEKNLGKNDGFRRQATPYLLYGYFSDMFISFKNLYSVLKNNGIFCLIVGRNRSRIGGKDTLIDTPFFLSLLAKNAGYSIDEIIPLQTYQRYEAHLKNSIDTESLIILRKIK